MSSPPERSGRRGPHGTLRHKVPDWLTPSGMTTLRVVFCLEGFGAGPAYTKGQLRLFVADLTGQV
ncbi:hypothetical protein, partial [Aquidulcibacter sp.]|uniref:hypothetical protein n=1 Tax=Aquidulcibacter sp. TaxID=2052990 RepID=UPI0025BD548E